MRLPVLATAILISICTPIAVLADDDSSSSQSDDSGYASGGSESLTGGAANSYGQGAPDNPPDYGYRRDGSTSSTITGRQFGDDAGGSDGSGGVRSAQ